MKRLLSILAAVAVVSGLLAMGAYAAKTDAPAPPSADQIKKGKADAPAAVAAAGVTCTIKNAAWFGTGATVVDKKSVQVSRYEVACSEGPGYYILAFDKGATDAYTCVQMAGAYALNKKGPRCSLPENMDINAQVQPVVDKSGLKCQVTDVLYLGTSVSDKVNHYEITCNGGGGYLIATTAAGAVSGEPNDCIAASPDAAHYQCKLTPRTAAVAQIGSWAQKYDSACQVSDARFVGRTGDTHEMFYEVACTGKVGFIVDVKNGAPVKSVTCLEAKTTIGAECTLSDLTAVKAAAGSSYAAVLKANGVTCTPTDTFIIGKDPRTKRDVVEFKCPEQPWGLVAVIPGAGATGQFEHYDCIGAQERTVDCTLNKKSDILNNFKPILTAIEKVCEPVDYKAHGPDDGDGDEVEVKCGGGQPGYILDLPATREKTIKTLTCEQAGRGDDKCIIPGNK